MFTRDSYPIYAMRQKRNMPRDILRSLLTFSFDSYVNNEWPAFDGSSSSSYLKMKYSVSFFIGLIIWTYTIKLRSKDDTKVGCKIADESWLAINE